MGKAHRHGLDVKGARARVDVVQNKGQRSRSEVPEIARKDELERPNPQKPTPLLAVRKGVG